MSEGNLWLLISVRLSSTTTYSCNTPKVSTIKKKKKDKEKEKCLSVF